MEDLTENVHTDKYKKRVKKVKKQIKNEFEKYTFDDIKNIIFNIETFGENLKINNQISDNEEKKLIVCALKFDTEACYKLMEVYKNRKDYVNLWNWLNYFNIYDITDCFTIDRFTIARFRIDRDDILPNNAHVRGFKGLSMDWYYTYLIDEASKIKDDAKVKFYTIKKFLNHTSANRHPEVVQYINELFKENNELKIELQYRPDGIGAKECETNFYTVSKKLEKTIKSWNLIY